MIFPISLPWKYHPTFSIKAFEWPFPLGLGPLWKENPSEDFFQTKMVEYNGQLQMVEI
jgi:hypothetical protein